MKNLDEKINLILSQISIEEIEQAKEILEVEEYLKYICCDYDSNILYDEHSNDFEC
jgi:hypothetical protein